MREERIFVGNYQGYNYLVALDENGKIWELCNLPTTIFKPAFVKALQKYIDEGKHLEKQRQR